MSPARRIPALTAALSKRRAALEALLAGSPGLAERREAARPARRPPPHRLPRAPHAGRAGEELRRGSEVRRAGPSARARGRGGRTTSPRRSCAARFRRDARRRPSAERLAARFERDAGAAASAERLEALLAAVRREFAARDAALAVLASPLADTDGGRLERRLEKAIRARLARRARRLLERGVPEEGNLHEARIDARDLRYGLEFAGLAGDDPPPAAPRAIPGSGGERPRPRRADRAREADGGRAVPAAAARGPAPPAAAPRRRRARAREGAGRLPRAPRAPRRAPRAAGERRPRGPRPAPRARIGPRGRRGARPPGPGRRPRRLRPRRPSGSVSRRTPFSRSSTSLPSLLSSSGTPRARRSTATSAPSSSSRRRTSRRSTRRLVVNPAGALYVARVSNPDGSRRRGTSGRAKCSPGVEVDRLGRPPGRPARRGRGGAAGCACRGPPGRAAARLRPARNGARTRCGSPGDGRRVSSPCRRRSAPTRPTFTCPDASPGSPSGRARPANLAAGNEGGRRARNEAGRGWSVDRPRAPRTDQTGRIRGPRSALRPLRLARLFARVEDPPEPRGGRGRRPRRLLAGLAAGRPLRPVARRPAGVDLHGRALEGDRPPPRPASGASSGRSRSTIPP